MLRCCSCGGHFWLVLWRALQRPCWDMAVHPAVAIVVCTYAFMHIATLLVWPCKGCAELLLVAGCKADAWIRCRRSGWCAGSKAMPCTRLCGCAQRKALAAFRGHLLQTHGKAHALQELLHQSHTACLSIHALGVSAALSSHVAARYSWLQLSCTAAWCGLACVLSAELCAGSTPLGLVGLIVHLCCVLAAPKAGWVLLTLSCFMLAVAVIIWVHSCSDVMAHVNAAITGGLSCCCPISDSSNKKNKQKEKDWSCICMLGFCSQAGPARAQPAQKARACRSLGVVHVVDSVGRRVALMLALRRCWPYAGPAGFPFDSSIGVHVVFCCGTNVFLCAM